MYSNHNDAKCHTSRTSCLTKLLIISRLHEVVKKLFCLITMRLHVMQSMVLQRPFCPSVCLYL